MSDKHYVLEENGRIRGLVGQSCEHFASKNYRKIEVTSQQISSIHGRNPFDGSIKLSELFAMSK